MVKQSRATRVGIAALILVTLGVLPASMAHAQVISPSGYASTAGNTGNNTLDQIAARVYQTQIAASELSAFAVGNSITGISFRLATGAAAPTTDQTFASYQVTLSSAANTIPNFTTSFAGNMGGNVTTVYDSSLTFTAASYSSGATGTTPNAFGPTISFTTPYTYQGGDLVITIRHSGTGGTVTAPFLDAINTSAASYGTTVVTQVSTQSQTATTSNAGGNAVIMRLNGSVVPEANTAALLGLALPLIGAVVVARRRRTTA